MRTFKQNKLWRDKTVDRMEQHGSKIHWHRLNNEEFDKQIRIKLLEESEEVAVAKNRAELINELADLYEVIDAIAELHKISEDEITVMQTKKQKERGDFSGRRFVEVSEHPVGSFGEKYCLANPVKYPEVD